MITLASALETAAASGTQAPERGGGMPKASGLWLVSVFWPTWTLYSDSWESLGSPTLL